jgi:hypothetical protein
MGYSPPSNHLDPITISETHLHMGKTWGLSTELPDWELSPCKEACMILDTSVKIPESSMGVCISISIKLPHLYCIPRCVFYLPSLVDRLVDRIGI